MPGVRVSHGGRGGREAGLQQCRDLQQGGKRDFGLYEGCGDLLFWTNEETSPLISVLPTDSDKRTCWLKTRMKENM